MEKKITLQFELSEDTVKAALWAANIEIKLTDEDWEKLTANPITLNLKDMGLGVSEQRQLELAYSLIAVGRVINL